MRTEGAVRFYEFLLVLYPKSHRAEYGPDMVQLFADRYRDERPTGDFFRFVRFWGGMVGDIFRTALAERTESVVSSFKLNWWKWAIGLFAALQGVFLAEASARLVTGDDDLGLSWGLRVLEFTVPLVTVIGLVSGLRLLTKRPRVASILLTVGLSPVILSGPLFFWFPPMWLVSLLGIYLTVKVFMETGRITRASAAPA